MRRLSVVFAVAVVAAGCTAAAADTPPASTAEPRFQIAETTTTTVPFDCPVTLPGEGMATPEGFPEPSLPGHVWYGTPELFTQLPVDGAYQQRKSVWWSVSFPGGNAESQPELRVTWERLDGTAFLSSDQGTNAHTTADGWFMMSGIDPNGEGCWQVTATYKGATTSYVYRR